MNIKKSKFKKVINEISKKIIQHYHPEKIILFGSYAAEKIKPDSDIDMLIIKKVKNKSFAERWLEISKITRDLKRRISLEPLVYTPLEIKNMIKKEDFFIKEIIQQGKIVYEK